MRQAGCALAASLFAASLPAADSPATLNNDDSCEIIVAPAATLLLPYFEVDLEQPTGETTLFTVTNVTRSPQVAWMTLWTDRSYPVVSFFIFLTGYDTQAINMFDLLARGRIAEPGTTSDSHPGQRSLDNDENPLLDVGNCDRIVVVIPRTVLRDMQTALTTGLVAECGETQRVGGTHAHAVGYLTMDVVSSCSVISPTEARYHTSFLLYDNVLTGDYQQVNSSQNFAQGGTMVHIRAVPEGGAPGAKTTNFSRTFYSNFQNGGTRDRRQPLPSTFATRWIEGGGSQFKTSFKIWREGVTRADTGCAVSANGIQTYLELVRVDEQENPTTFTPCFGCGGPEVGHPRMPSTSRLSSADGAIFPPNPDAVAGWMYFNLNDPLPAVKPRSIASQSWVISSMEAEGRYSVDFDAAAIGNGCTPPTPETDEDGGLPAVGSVPNVISPAFMTGSPSTIANDDSCDVRVAPAATLLLPYFEVDLTSPLEETTLFTVTNVTQSPQIARVTLWTDWAFPVLNFNIFLTGYDVQSINLFDVLARGRIAEPGTSSSVSPGRRSADNHTNPLLDLSSCGSIADRIPAALLLELQSVLTIGRTQMCGSARVGGTHTRAIGYATIDVVRNCGTAMPTDSAYFTSHILYDNTLLGDYQQVSSSQNFAQGNAMVHIRAIPEGGVSGAAETRLRRTFYSRLQNGGKADRRQPLPSTFAARWISGGGTGYQTTFKIWREGVTSSTAGCAVSANSTVPVPDFVRFDEDENPSVLDHPCCCILCPPSSIISFPTTSRIELSDTLHFPPNDYRAVAGWMYLNLDSGHPQDDVPLQSWVITSMKAEGRYSVDFDATALGNGCSGAMPVTDENTGAPAIGPAPDTNPEGSQP